MIPNLSKLDGLTVVQLQALIADPACPVEVTDYCKNLLRFKVVQAYVDKNTVSVV